MLEGLYRIFGSSFESRINTKDNTDGESGKEGESENLPTNIWREWGDNGDEEGYDIAQN